MQSHSVTLTAVSVFLSIHSFLRSFIRPFVLSFLRRVRSNESVCLETSEGSSAHFQTNTRGEVSSAALGRWRSHFTPTPPAPPPPFPSSPRFLPSSLLLLLLMLSVS